MILYLETTTPKTVEKSRNKYSMRCNLEPVFLSVATSYLLRRLLIYLQLVCLLNSASVTLIAQFYPRTILVASRKLHSYAAYISRIPPHNDFVNGREIEVVVRAYEVFQNLRL